MTRTIAVLVLFGCTIIAGCAADQSGSTSPQADQGSSPNNPRRSAARPDQPGAPAGQGSRTVPKP